MDETLKATIAAAVTAAIEAAEQASEARVAPTEEPEPARHRFGHFRVLPDAPIKGWARAFE